MADIPASLDWGIVEGYLGELVSDSPDEGRVPDVEDLTGIVLLQPVVDDPQWDGYVQVGGEGGGIFAVKDLECPVVAGVLMSPDGGGAGVSLIATVQTNALPTTIQWRATFKLDGVKRQPRSRLFNVPGAGQVVRLEDQLGEPGELTPFVIVSDEDRRRAEEAATRASQYRDGAFEEANRAEAAAEAAGALEPVVGVDGKLLPEVLPEPLTDAGLSAKIGEQVEGALASTATATSPLGILRARAQSRETEPVVIVGLGNSIMAGTDAGGPAARWINLLAGAAQATYPLASGTSPATRSLAEAVATPPTAPGVQFVNAGVGGTVASDFLTPTTLPQVTALDPAAIIIYIGVNDWHAGDTAATFKAALTTQLDNLRSGMDEPCAFIFVHGHPRTVSTSTVDWDTYRRALQEIVAEHPGDSMLIDTSVAFREVGIYLGGTDVLGIMSDTVHPNARGHAFLYELVRASLGFAVPPKAATATSSRPVVASETFDGDAPDINGRSFDGLLGGARVPVWVAPIANRCAVVNGRLATGAGTGGFYVFFPEVATNFRISFTLSARPDGTALAFVFHRANAGTDTATANEMRINIGSRSSGSAVTIQSRSAGTVTEVAALGGTVADGTRVTVEVNGTTVSVYLNGTLHGSGTILAGLLTKGYTGFEASSTLTGVGVDNILIESLATV